MDSLLTLNEVVAKPDKDISRLIKGKLPPNTFSSVVVSTMDYQFPLSQNSIPTKCIYFNITQSKKVVKFFHAFFSGIGIIPDGEKNYETKLDENKLKNELITIICNSNSEEWETIELAAKRATEIQFYIAKDLTGIQIKLKKNTSIIISYNLGKIIPPILKTVPVILAAIETNNHQ